MRYRKFYLYKFWDTFLKLFQNGDRSLKIIVARAELKPDTLNGMNLFFCFILIVLVDFTRIEAFLKTAEHIYILWYLIR